MHPGNLRPSDFVAALGGVLLGISVFLPWYEPNEDNRNAVVAGSREAVSAWDAHAILRFLFLGEVSLAYGWFGALTGVILMAFGGAARASTTERPRKPPGVL